MADVHDIETRSRNMRQIKSKDTGPEMVVRRFLYANGIRYRLHVKALPGKPDIVIKKYKTIIDVRGCFWHGHRKCKYGEVKSESSIKETRVIPAMERDIRNEKAWKELGWNVIIVWDSCELEIKKKKSEKREAILKDLLKKLQKNSDTNN
ncbi:MAG: very short patch repair endonuclease [Chitinophagaceae bacterium]